ncbi:MAG: hypothetical protein M1836_007538 [Candelina mexicana]|nr:MAG: hypothetical protein M1836_007538 [Candelina mexicana]
MSTPASAPQTPHPTSSFSSSIQATHAPPPPANTLSPLEQEILDEYARLLDNMNTLSTQLHNLSTPPTASTNNNPSSISSSITKKGEGVELEGSETGNGSLPEILDSLRGLERKTGLVFTLLKASVYSIVLQQQIWSGEEGG